MRDSVKSSEVMFGPKITSSGWQPRNRAALASASPKISLTRRLVAYPAPRLALASRSAAAIASPTSSGTCEPPGASRNAKPCRSDEKRARIAATSMLWPAISSSLPIGAGGGRRAPSTTPSPSQAQITVPCPGAQGNDLISVQIRAAGEDVLSFCLAGRLAGTEITREAMAGPLGRPR